MSESKPTDILLVGSKRKWYPPQSWGGTNNFCIFKTLNPGHSWDQNPTFAIAMYNSSICYFFFGQEIQFKKKPNNFSSVAVPQQQHNSNSVQICPTHPILSACTDLAKTLALPPPPQYYCSTDCKAPCPVPMSHSLARCGIGCREQSICCSFKEDKLELCDS